MKKSTKRVQITLNLKKFNTSELILFLRAVAKGLPGNLNFTSEDMAKLPIAIADMNKQATNLENTHTSRQANQSESLTALEHDQATIVMNTIKDTAAFVEGIANKKATGDAAIAVLIITSVGFQVKKEFTHHQRTFEAVSTDTGQVHLRTKAIGNRTAYFWQYSDDGGKSWAFPIITIGSEVIIIGLKSKTDYNFRFATTLPVIEGKPIVTAGSQQLVWSDIITVLIP